MDKTLSDARAEFYHAAEDQGMDCPCCGRFGRYYRRKFNSGMALSLIWLVYEWRANGHAWIDVPKVAPRRVLRSREFDKLAHWRLVEKSEDRGETHGDSILSGLWRPAEYALAFVDGRATIKSHAIFYDNKVLRFEPERTNIHQALQEKFDYSELMRGVWPDTPT